MFPAETYHVTHSALYIFLRPGGFKCWHSTFAAFCESSQSLMFNVFVQQRSCKYLCYSRSNCSMQKRLISLQKYRACRETKIQAFCVEAILHEVLSSGSMAYWSLIPRSVSQLPPSAFFKQSGFSNHSQSMLQILCFPLRHYWCASFLFVVHGCIVATLLCHWWTRGSSTSPRFDCPTNLGWPVFPLCVLLDVSCWISSSHAHHSPVLKCNWRKVRVCFNCILSAVSESVLNPRPLVLPSTLLKYLLYKDGDWHALQGTDTGGVVLASPPRQGSLQLPIFSLYGVCNVSKSSFLAPVALCTENRQSQSFPSQL